MSKVHVLKVDVGPNVGNPAPFMSQIEFEITFECIEALPEDLVWKIIYVGSAESEAYDQILDTVYVGPIPEGRHKFIFAAEPPDARKIPVSDVVDVTVILLTCGYREQEFIRIGYYVNNGYTDPQMQETPPEAPQFDKLQRNILASNPRINKVKINWERTGTSSLREELAATHSNDTTAHETVLKEGEPMDESTNKLNSNDKVKARVPSLHYDADDDMSNSSVTTTTETPMDKLNKRLSSSANNSEIQDSFDSKEENTSSIDKALDESIKAFNDNDDKKPTSQTDKFMEIRES